jgi:hypothetical protein
MSGNTDVSEEQAIIAWGRQGLKQSPAGPFLVTGVLWLDVLLSKLAREFGDCGIRRELPVDFESLLQFLKAGVFRSAPQ